MEEVKLPVCKIWSRKLVQNHWFRGLKWLWRKSSKDSRKKHMGDTASEEWVLWRHTNSRVLSKLFLIRIWHHWPDTQAVERMLQAGSIWLKPLMMSIITTLMASLFSQRCLRIKICHSILSQRLHHPNCSWQMLVNSTKKSQDKNKRMRSWWWIFTKDIYQTYKRAVL